MIGSSAVGPSHSAFCQHRRRLSCRNASRCPYRFVEPLPPGTKVSSTPHCALTPVGDHDSFTRKMAVPLQVPDSRFRPAKRQLDDRGPGPGYAIRPRCTTERSPMRRRIFKLWSKTADNFTAQWKVKRARRCLRSSPYAFNRRRLSRSPSGCLSPSQMSIQNGAGSLRSGRCARSRFRARRFMTEFRWKFALTAGQKADLGTFVLRRGSSVIGNVQTRYVEHGSTPETRSHSRAPFVR